MLLTDTCHTMHNLLLLCCPHPTKCNDDAASQASAAAAVGVSTLCSSLPSLLLRQVPLLVRVDQVLASRVGEQVRHQLPLDARRGNDKRLQCKEDKLAAVQLAGHVPAPVGGRQAEKGVKELVGGGQVQRGQQLHAKHVERGLRALLLGPQLLPHCSSCLLDALAAAHCRHQLVSHAGRLTEGAGDRKACCGVDEVGGCTEGSHRLVACRQGPTHRDVAPLLLVHLLHLDAH
mmetsp:Transcript_142/g.309  ORF Transcript_142/g.309 Transcript_142/m.309 type:complete len:232 (+) Transcript_142:477-1172(+)